MPPCWAGLRRVAPESGEGAAVACAQAGLTATPCEPGRRVGCSAGEPGAGPSQQGCCRPRAQTAPAGRGCRRAQEVGRLAVAVGPVGRQSARCWRRRKPRPATAACSAVQAGMPPRLVLAARQAVLRGAVPRGRAGSGFHQKGPSLLMLRWQPAPGWVKAQPDPAVRGARRGHPARRRT